MAHVDDIPDIDPDPTQEKSEVWVSLDGKAGEFYWKDAQKKKVTARSLKLVLGSIVATWDPKGNPDERIPPRWSIAIYGQIKGLGDVQIKIGAQQSIISAVKDLRFIAPGDIISLYCEPGTDVTFIKVYRWDGTAWAPQRGDKIEGGIDPAVNLLRQHSAFDHQRSHAKAFAEGEQPTYGVPQSSPVPAAPPPAAAAEGSSPQQPPASAGAAPKVSAPVSPSVPNDVAIGAWRPRLWYLAEHLEQPPRDTQISRFDGLVSSFGLLGDDAGKVHQGVCDACKIPAARHRSFAGYMMVNDFLANSSSELIEELIKTTEHDPFADQ
jgi:hypothetical protein